jgi:hypothetical protein
MQVPLRGTATGTGTPTPTATGTTGRRVVPARPQCPPIVPQLNIPVTSSSCSSGSFHNSTVQVPAWTTRTQTPGRMSLKRTTRTTETKRWTGVLHCTPCWRDSSSVFVLVNLSTSYYGLRIGAGSQMSMVSGLWGFVGFKLFSKHTAVRFSAAENVLVISVATATGCMPVTAGFVGIIPALEYLIGPEENGPHHCICIGRVSCSGQWALASLVSFSPHCFESVS